MSYPARTPQVIAVEVPRPHVVRVTFDDHFVRELEYKCDAARPHGVFGPLADPAFFASVTVEHGTLVWPNGVDLDPVVLHGDATAARFDHFTLLAEERLQQSR
jgi:hypothetical protein